MSRLLSFYNQNQKIDAIYVRLYLYNLGFIIIRESENNPGLNQILLQQLTAMFYKGNSFIAIYKIAFEGLQNLCNLFNI